MQLQFGVWKVHDGGLHVEGRHGVTEVGPLMCLVVASAAQRCTAGDYLLHLHVQYARGSGGLEHAGFRYELGSAKFQALKRSSKICVAVTSSQARPIKPILQTSEPLANYTSCKI